MKLLLWYSIYSDIEFLVLNQKYIEFVTWQKKNFLNRMKNEAAIDFFVKRVLAANHPKAESRAESHALFHGTEQFDDGFDRNFLGHELYLPP